MSGDKGRPIDEASRVIAAIENLEQLEEILRDEGERNWISGVRAAKRAGMEFLAVGNHSEALASMASIFRTMHSGPGGFDDFFVWRASTAERVEANRELKQIKKDLWEHLRR